MMLEQGRHLFGLQPGPVQKDPEYTQSMMIVGHSWFCSNLYFACIYMLAQHCIEYHFALGSVGAEPCGVGSLYLGCVLVWMTGFECASSV